jgi:ankyrin repeat protein
VDKIDGDEATALHWAAANGHQDTMSTLLNAGARIDEKDMQGRTPLHEAARSGNEGAVLRLIEAGASIDAKDNACKTPLNLATSPVIKSMFQSIFKAISLPKHFD